LLKYINNTYRNYSIFKRVKIYGRSKEREIYRALNTSTRPANKKERKLASAPRT
jgi:hypothetical protein